MVTYIRNIFTLSLTLSSLWTVCTYWMLSTDAINFKRYANRHNNITVTSLQSVCLLYVLQTQLSANDFHFIYYTVCTLVYEFCGDPEFRKILLGLWQLTPKKCALNCQKTSFLFDEIITHYASTIVDGAW